VHGAEFRQCDRRHGGVSAGDDRNHGGNGRIDVSCYRAASGDATASVDAGIAWFRAILHQEAACTASAGSWLRNSWPCVLVGLRRR